MLGTRCERRHRPLEQIERAVEQRVVAPVLDHPAGVRHGGAVAPEQFPGVGEREPASDVRQVHSDLPGKRDLGAAARQPAQVLAADAEDLDHRLLDGVARERRQTAAVLDEAQGRVLGCKVKSGGSVQWRATWARVPGNIFERTGRLPHPHHTQARRSRCAKLEAE